ncbi:hypothetical protein CEXT_124261, partial [Caerostris extrusa]
QPLERAAWIRRRRSKLPYRGFFFSPVFIIREFAGKESLEAKTHDIQHFKIRPGHQ